MDIQLIYMAIDNARIQKSISRLRKFAKKVPKDPSPAEVHKLRTNARKLEAAFGALSLDSNKNERQLLKEVKKIRKRAGRVRDLDVLTGHLAGVQIDGEQECQVRLLEHLGTQRRKQSAKLRDVISNHRVELKTRLNNAADDLEAFLADNEPEPSSLAAAHALQLSSEMDSPKRLNRGNLHPYRLKVKELRYVLQLAPNSDSEFIDDLGEVKDAIGEWHDWEELIAIANDVLDHGPGCGLMRKLKETSNSKFDEGLRLAENLRKKYLKSGSRKKPSQSVRLSPEAMAATEALSGMGQRAA